MDIEKLMKAFNEREHIDPALAWKEMTQATKWNETLVYLWKIPNKDYEKWFNENKEHFKSTLEQETTYIVFSGQKAFDSTKAGYSIFAISLGDIVNDRHYCIDRIERAKLEYAIDITDLYREEQENEVQSK